MTGLNAVIRRFRGSRPQQWGKTGQPEFADLPGEDAPAEFYAAFDRINAEVFNNELERIPIRTNTGKFNSGFVSHYNDTALGLEFIGFWETFPRDPEYMYEHMARNMAYVSRRSAPALIPAAPAPSLPARVSPPPDWDEPAWYEPAPDPVPVVPVYAELRVPDVPLARWMPDLARAVQPAPARPNLEPLLTAAIQALARVQRSAARQPRTIPAAPVAPAGPPMEAMLAALAQAMAVNQRPFIDVTPRPNVTGQLPSPTIESVFDITPGRAKTPTGRR
jgi:hypothetical protein